MSEEKRIIAIPGETIKSGREFLPGEGSRREGDNIVASRFGLVDESGRFVRVIPLSGIYMPRRGNLVIGKVVDIAFNGWMMDIKCPYSSFIMVSEYPKFINQEDLAEYLDIGDMVLCKISKVKRKGTDLTLKGRELGKLEEGMIMTVNSNKVPRVIGREGSMIKLIKDATNCEIVVGQNGIIWIRGKDVEDEIYAKEEILFVVEKSYINGLTDAVKEFLDKNKKTSKEDKE
jgi:exosome complex component RRP4